MTILIDDTGYVTDDRSVELLKEMLKEQEEADTKKPIS